MICTGAVVLEEMRADGAPGERALHHRPTPPPGSHRAALHLQSTPQRGQQQFPPLPGLPTHYSPNARTNALWV
jgi:hypothetical protein